MLVAAGHRPGDGRGHRRPQGGEDHLLLARLVRGELADDPQVERAQLDRVLLLVETFEQLLDAPMVLGEQVHHVVYVGHDRRPLLRRTLGVAAAVVRGHRPAPREPPNRAEGPSER